MSFANRKHKCDDVLQGRLVIQDRTKDTASGFNSANVLVMCRQTGNLWYKVNQKGRGKKGWDGTLRQNEDF